MQILSSTPDSTREMPRLQESQDAVTYHLCPDTFKPRPKKGNGKVICTMGLKRSCAKECKDACPKSLSV